MIVIIRVLASLPGQDCLYVGLGKSDGGVQRACLLGLEVEAASPFTRAKQFFDRIGGVRRIRVLPPFRHESVFLLD